MKLLYKQSSQQTKTAMRKVAESYISKENSYQKEAETKILSKTNHTHCRIVNSGNAAIMVAMNAIEGPILIPDQGAWHGFKQIAKFLNKEIIIFKTDLGIINLEKLDNILKQYPFIKNNNNTNNNTNNKNNNKINITNKINNNNNDSNDKDNNDIYSINEKVPGLFLTSFAGYTGEQPMKEISNWCKENGIFLVEDASGAITDSEKKLANGNYSDIIVCSTSSPKVINVGDGGFITTDNKEIFEKSKLLLNICKSNEITYKGIATEIEFAENNLKKTIESTKYIKNNLENVIHKNKRGTNVIIQSENPYDLVKNLKKQFDLEGRSFITKCPNYNRIKQKAVAIEIKNIDTKSLTKDNLDEIINIIRENYV
jgi:DegT/DnrJ/EryC1/StrS aminotransferase family protein